MTTTPDWPMLDALARFARAEVAANDIEPWAATLAELHRAGAFAGDEEAHWAVALYNTYDGFGSAFGVLARWPGPLGWSLAEDRDDVARFECTQERRNLRGGRVVKRFASYASLVGLDTQEAWLRRGLAGGSPAADFTLLTIWMRRVWGVGRQSAFEWAEFVAKVFGWAIDCEDGQWWESEGPRRSLQRLYGNPTPSVGWLNDRAHECREWLASEQGVNLAWVDFETVICDFNVMRDGRYYVGRHLAALREEIDSAPEAWRDPLEAAWLTIVPEKWQGIAPGIDPEKMPVFARTGEIVEAP